MVLADEKGQGKSGHYFSIATIEADPLSKRGDRRGFQARRAGGLENQSPRHGK